MDAIFTDRSEAGHRLAEALGDFKGTDALVLGMARGGVEIGFVVAQDLDLPLAALVVRKIGAPYNPELAIGAVSETGVKWIDYDLVQATGASRTYLQKEVERQIEEAERRQKEYSAGTRPSEVQGRTGIVVDDGIATGASALVAVDSVRDLGAAKVVLATPVASAQALSILEGHVDQVVVLTTPDPFMAVGMHYVHFSQLSDDEVIRYLAESRRHWPAQTAAN